MDAACKKFLSRYPELQFIKDTGKIKCSLSGHEMPCRVDTLRSYVSGKKFTKLKANHDFNFSWLEPFLVRSKKRKYQLYCALTNRYVNKKPDEVTGHINGRRYKQAMEKYNAGEMTLFEEKLKQTSGANLAVKEREEGKSLDIPPKGNLSLKSVSTPKDSTEESFWMVDSDDEDEMCHSKDVDGDGFWAEERPANEEESSCMERGKKRKGVAEAVGTIKRKKFESRGSNSSFRMSKMKKVK